ncbi:MAG TPA: cyclic beta 1-2 glucan synthetase, partial [Burkholderiales bacterium]|nr:cyclic beta 1-2 glucan synthetase [Burkholderiales bacterium]
NAQSVEDLIEALEVRFLANRDDNLYFGLLTDFTDAPEQTLPADEPLLMLARNRIDELNEKYGGGGKDAFFLFHRPRRWNARERRWMGYERKRGKLADLNLRLRDTAYDGFSLAVGPTEFLAAIKYVITLDTDTQLPRDAARQFVGAMAHPLNRPHYDEARQRVVSGYSIMQPRVAVSLPAKRYTPYARLFGAEPGIDPYTRAVSDVYQDAFGEGSFIGKGIYDVDAFERALKDRFPENRILSHDLLEGSYARAALLSDVELYEEYPSTYAADVSRRHRWIRGDWQIASWLVSRVPGNAAASQPNPLSMLSQWKIFDNLRRSLAPAALLTLMLLGWTVLSPAWLWTLAVIAIVALPPLIASLIDAVRKPDDALWRQHIAVSARSVARHFAQAVFTLAWLPYEAWFSLDAIVRTNWRMLVSRRRLLEWTPSGSSTGERTTRLAATYRRMWPAPLLAAAGVAWLATRAPASLHMALPILFLWLAAPAIAWSISRPLPPRASRLGESQVVFLRKLARRTWAFFETFVGADDHWLPPDNFQEHPTAVIAHRTSPTNIGLSLLANLTAYDFGYI